MPAALVSCGQGLSGQGPGVTSGLGVVNGGGGLEDLDATSIGVISGDSGTVDGSIDATRSADAASDGSNVGANEETDSASAEFDASEGGGLLGDGANGEDAGSSSANGGDGSPGDGSVSDGSTGGNAGDGGNDDASDGESVGDGSRGNDAADGSEGDSGTGGLQLNLGGNLHLTSLTWTITGPNAYSGSVTIGDAQSIEWVIGGVAAGDGYTLSVTAVDTEGGPCQGTSPPFNVQPGVVDSAMLTITCDSSSAASPAEVTTGSVIVQANVVSSDD